MITFFESRGFALDSVHTCELTRIPDNLPSKEILFDVTRIHHKLSALKPLVRERTSLASVLAYY